MERYKQLSIIILPAILCLLSLPTFAQEAEINYGHGESISLKIKQGVYSVYSQEEQSLTSLASDTAFITAHVASLRFSDYDKEELSSNNPKVLINPVFEDGHGNTAYVDNKINLYMFEPTTEVELQKLLDADELNLTVQEKFWRGGGLATYHTVAISPPYQNVSIVELTNRINALSGVKMAFPNLINKVTPSSIHGITDTYYSNKWEHGRIESELAWTFTMGNPAIRIGILDNGIDHDHEDLTDNIWRDGQGNVMGGDFTSDGFSTGRPYGDESHGTHCAGLAAAPINDVGVVGAAPGVSLVPLKIATGHSGTARSWQVSESGFLDAMNYSIDNDIDVLSASFGLVWGGNTALLNQSFDDALTDGRNGKGIVIIFSSGNTGSDYALDDISHRSDVITVGATTPQDLKWDYSTYPSGDLDVKFVDIAAPSGSINQSISNYTTDIEGNNGSTSGNYEAYFGGTSGAAPLIAGAAALLYHMTMR